MTAPQPWIKHNILYLQVWEYVFLSLTMLVIPEQTSCLSEPFAVWPSFVSMPDPFIESAVAASADPPLTFSI